MNDEVGKYAYLVGVIIALIVGILASYIPATAITWLTSIIILAGLVVGFMNVGTKEVKDFLLVSTVLVITAGLGGATVTLGAVEVVGPYLAGVLTQLMAFVIPATVVVALKAVLELAKK
ncbi:hypothetical protein KY343_03825 [Candidatus Woesearchaeota archaeon]|nr:hypothetical protein [Candidatus Woesearchaeota archaeon]